MHAPVPVRWTAPAANDLKEISRFIRRDNPAVARAVAKALFDAANSLDRFPLRGRIGVIPGTRELVLPRLPYIVVYRFHKEAVTLLRILHAARDLSLEM